MKKIISGDLKVTKMIESSGVTITNLSSDDTLENVLVADSNGLIHRRDASSLGGTGDSLFETGTTINSTQRKDVGNIADGSFSASLGGCNNAACGDFSIVGGGRGNVASGYNSTVGGGCGNTASFFSSTVGGGDCNTASGPSSTVGGGIRNTASGYYSTIGGGDCNTASGSHSTVAGGDCNTASGNYTGVLGGRDNNTNNFNCAMIVGSNITAIAACTTHVNCLAIMNIPTDPTGLCAGMVWNDGGTLKIV